MCPYTLSADFVEPSNSEISIWRYMDFTKFVSMLEYGALFFPRADTLEDPFEGTLGLLNQYYRKHPEEYLKTNPVDYVQVVAMSLEEYKKKHEQNRKSVMISCWHMNEHES